MEEDIKSIEIAFVVVFHISSKDWYEMFGLECMQNFEVPKQNGS